MRSQVQLSAEAAFGHVEPNPRSLDAILRATAALHPQYQAVGDFHSHPYDESWELDAKRGWDYTPDDEDSNIVLARAMAEHAQRIDVTFVIAIARSGHPVARRHYKQLRNTIQMSLGNCRVILAAYRSLESGRLTRSNIHLRLSGPST
jgi:hypothetical protein